MSPCCPVEGWGGQSWSRGWSQCHSNPRSVPGWRRIGTCVRNLTAKPTISVIHLLSIKFPKLLKSHWKVHYRDHLPLSRPLRSCKQGWLPSLIYQLPFHLRRHLESLWAKRWAASCRPLEMEGLKQTRFKVQSQDDSPVSPASFSKEERRSQRQESRVVKRLGSGIGKTLSSNPISATFRLCTFKQIR